MYTPTQHLWMFVSRWDLTLYVFWLLSQADLFLSFWQEENNMELWVSSRLKAPMTDFFSRKWTLTYCDQTIDYLCIDFVSLSYSVQDTNTGSANL